MSAFFGCASSVQRTQLIEEPRSLRIILGNTNFLLLKLVFSSSLSGATLESDLQDLHMRHSSVHAFL